VGGVGGVAQADEIPHTGDDIAKIRRSMSGGSLLTTESFEGLLRALDPDRDNAAHLYEDLRERLIGLHRWWGSPDPSGLADLTLDRVARKIAEGTPIPPGSLGAFVRGVARMIFHESARQRVEPLGGYEPAAESHADPPIETALACLDRCLETLTAPDRKLVLRYYGEGAHIEVRKGLAADLGISMTALRLRTHRLRLRLERCVSSCLEEP
jgi:DNA-directed RNA polymerase specialized sigma24 family protein